MPKSQPSHKITYDVQISCQLTQTYMGASGGVSDNVGEKKDESSNLADTLERIFRESLKPYKSIEISSLQVLVSMSSPWPEGSSPPVLLRDLTQKHIKEG